MYDDSEQQSIPLRCPQCGTDNPDTATYCGSCGAQLRSAFDRPSGPVTLAPEATPPPAPSAPVGPPSQDWGASATQSVDSPGAGLYQPPLAPPVQQPLQSYDTLQQPPPISQQTFYPAAFTPGMNTSGMGEGYPLPPETSGWNFGGFVPFGLFGFMNGSTLWGVLGLCGSLVGILGLVYSIVIGATGKQIAWKGKRFESVDEYVATMRGWNFAGLICLGISALLIVLYIVFMVGIFAVAMSEGDWN